MPKRTTAPALMLSERAGGTAHAWLCDALRREILSGRLVSGARLPATRALAAQHGLSRGTVVAAFDQLKAEGYLEGRTGSGTRVSRVLPDDLLRVADAGRREPVGTTHPPPLSAFARRVRPFPELPHRLRAFRAYVPALDLFPTTLWAQVAGRRLRRASAALLSDGDPLGYQPLRQAVAAYLREARGVVCEWAQVAIVSGVQDALDLVSRVTLDPGDRVVMESPGYPGAALVFAAMGVHVVRTPVDAFGMRTPGAAAAGARLAYVTPAHQYPMGVTMSLARRLALLEWSRRNGTLIFEDDYDSEYRYRGRPVRALQGLDTHGVVCLAGTFSKVLFPSLRLGYLVLPPNLVDAVAAAKSVTSRHAPVLHQAVLCDFITEGHFGRHVRRMRQVYAERGAVLAEEARRHWGERLALPPIDAGLQVAGRLAAPLDAEAVARAALARGVDAVPLSRFGATGRAAQVLHLGFAAIDPAEIRRGVVELARVLNGMKRRG